VRKKRKATPPRQDRPVERRRAFQRRQAHRLYGGPYPIPVRIPNVSQSGPTLHHGATQGEPVTALVRMTRRSWRKRLLQAWDLKTGCQDDTTVWGLFGDAALSLLLASRDEFHTALCPQKILDLRWVVRMDARIDCEL
jgi:hypothetical protein